MFQSEQGDGFLQILTERRAMLLGLMVLPAAGHGAALAANEGGAQMQPELYEGQQTGFEGKTSEQQLKELIDREQIRELTARYAHRVAHGVSIADLFTDDGAFILRYPGRPVRETRGRAALDKLFTASAANPARPLPMIHNHLVRINGDQAIGICSNELRMTEDGKSMIGSGYYEDQLRRESGHWRFVVRDMTFIHWVPIQQGWATA